MSRIDFFIQKLGIDNYEFCERAGIMEYEGNQPRAIAEQKAIENIADYKGLKNKFEYLKK